jgi:hypothetical protein
MSEDLPTLERPENAISGSSPGGAWLGTATVPAYSTVLMSTAGPVS